MDTLVKTDMINKATARNGRKRNSFIKKSSLGSGIFALLRRTRSTVGRPKRPTIINLLFSTPNLKLIGMLIDIKNVPTDKEVVMIIRLSLVISLFKSRDRIRHITRDRQIPRMPKRYLLYTNCFLVIGIVIAYLFHSARSS